MQTTRTYRFVNVAEQVFTMVGDGKHGLWRYQDSGLIREYITSGADGSGGGVAAPAESLADPLFLREPRNMDAFIDGLSGADMARLGTDYAATEHLGPNPGDSFGSPGNGGYKSYTGGFNSVSVNASGAVTMVDLPLNHPKYGGKYDDHVPIDLPAWYCTMSYNGYSSARAAMDFAFAQPGARDIGPLGKRAGVDITEYYQKVLRIHTFGDAQAWINTLDTASGFAGTDDVHHRRINTDKMDVEYYLVERAFFNEDYLFVIAIINSKGKTGKLGRGEFSYVRPEGAYYDHLVDRGFGRKLNTKFKHFPKFDVWVPNKKGKLQKKRQRAEGLRLYGMHHPGIGVSPLHGGPFETQIGGCPSMGGDFGEAYFGSAFAAQLQEVTPLCDAFVVDIKFYANLDGKTWADESKNLANATGSLNGDDTIVMEGDLTKNYEISFAPPFGVPPSDATYGDFTDLFLKDVATPDQFTTTGFDELTYPFPTDQVTCDEVNAGDCPRSPPSSP